MDEFPKEAGFPNLGIFVLQMHYKNKDMDSDVIDSTGVKFTYTKQLRAKT